MKAQSLRRWTYEALPGSGRAWIAFFSIRLGKRTVTIMWGRRFRRITERQYTKWAYPFMAFVRGVVGPSWPSR